MTVSASKQTLNFREELSSLKKPSGVKGEEILRSSTVDDVYNAIGNNKNILINGDFRISQRGDFTTASSLSTTAYRLDKWITALLSGSYTHQHKLNQVVNGIKTNTYNITCTSAAANGGFAIEQLVEAPEMYAGQTLTFSCWYKSNFDSWFNFYDGVNQPMFRMPNTNGQWQKFIATYTLSASNTYCRVEFFPYTTTPVAGHQIEIALCQLERGSVATPFEMRSPAHEISLCQRYYFKSGNMWLSGQSYTTNGSVNGFVTNYHFPTTMYSTPTVTVNGGSDGGSAAAIYVVNASPQGYGLNLRSTNSSTTVWWATFNVTAESNV